MTQTWYRIALARPDARPALVAVAGEHLGVAIASAEHQVRGSYAIAGEVTTDHVPLGESVRDRVVELGEAPPELAATGFHWPVGVLPQLGHPITGRRGYVVHPDPARLVIEAQTDAAHLTDLFLGLIERLPVDNLEVRLLDHFGDPVPPGSPAFAGAPPSRPGQPAHTTDVWLTSRVDGKKIIRFVDDHDADLIENGHLELSVYVRKHHATLRLTEHKSVVWIAEAGALQTEVTGWLRELEVQPVERLVLLATAPHYHYRPAKSRDRVKLADHLYRQRLRRVDRIEPAVAPRETDG